MLLDDIEIFTVISETKSLSQAAERLYICLLYTSRCV